MKSKASIAALKELFNTVLKDELMGQLKPPADIDPKEEASEPAEKEMPEKASALAKALAHGSDVQDEYDTQEREEPEHSGAKKPKAVMSITRIEALGKKAAPKKPEFKKSKK
jgi:hypothetical protein